MINLKREMEKLIFTDAEKDIIILRHLTGTKCICTSQPKMIYDEKRKTQIPNPHYRTGADPTCQNCDGAGWIFDEYLLDCKYFYTPTLVAHNQDFAYGSTNSNTLSIFFPISNISRSIQGNDLVFQIGTTDDGEIIDPIVRTKKWIVTDVYELHLDGNKPEFMKVFAKPAVI